MAGQADAAVEIALVNDLREIPAAAARIDEFCAQQEIAPEVAYAVNLALDELLANTITYGYDDEEPHRIEVIVRLEGDTLVVAIIDDGMAFDPTRVPDTDVTGPPDERELGGLGLMLVNRMMDSTEYQRRADCNVVVLTKGTAVSAQAGPIA